MEYYVPQNYVSGEKKNQQTLFYMLALCPVVQIQLKSDNIKV